MDKEIIAHLRERAQHSWDSRDQFAGWADVVMECLDEIERLTGWENHLFRLASEDEITSEVVMESLLKSRSGEAAPL